MRTCSRPSTTGRHTPTISPSRPASSFRCGDCRGPSRPTSAAHALTDRRHGRQGSGRSGGSPMPVVRSRKGDDPYAAETSRQVGERAAPGLLFFGLCVVLSSIFDIARFPERTPWMLGFAAAFLALGTICLLLVRRYAEWS